MEFAASIPSKIGEYLLEATIHQVRYLFCFSNIVEDLQTEENNLKTAQNDIKDQVEEEEKSTRKVKREVEKWLTDADNVLADVQSLKEEIQVKKTCLNGWCPNWGWRYWLGRKAAKKTTIMLKLQKSRGKFNTEAPLKSLPGIEFLASKHFLSSEANKLASRQIIEALKNEKTNMVGLYGTGGVGKTTLAKEVGNQLHKQKIFDEVVIATISQHPNFLNIQDQLKDSLGMEFEKEASKEGTAQRLYLRFTDTKSKILVILDDLWEDIDLKNELGIPVDDDHNSCKVLITSRQRQVLTKMECQSEIKLNILVEKEGLALLKKSAGINNDAATHLDPMIHDVARECDGLPLALVSIGKALRGKGIEEWKNTSQKLQKSRLEELPDVSGEKGVYVCLKSSYDYLKDEKIKLFFLLCSLFPEDYEIPINELVRYGIGIGLFEDANTIEDARNELCHLVGHLIDSSLLLDTGKEGFVKMHDVVRDVALWIGSKEKKFMSKAGIRLTEWPEGESLEESRAISMMGSKMKVLPNGLVCPKLELLLLEGGNVETMMGFTYYSKMVVPDQFFKEMKALKVVTMRYADLSLKSLEHLMNLQCLQLIGCNLRDMSSLGNLKRLQILSLESSVFDEIPEELGEIGKLRSLNLCNESFWEIPLNLMKRFSRLEELYGKIGKWDVKETSSGRSNSTLSELNSSAETNMQSFDRKVECLPEDFIFPKLHRYDIDVNCNYTIGLCRTTRLKIQDMEASKLSVFKALYENLQHLILKNAIGCQNIVPSIIQRGLNELTSLDLERCEEMECIYRCPHFCGLFKNLTEISVIWCSMKYLFSLPLPQSIVQRKELEVRNGRRLKDNVEGIIDDNECIIPLPMLKKLLLIGLPNLISFCSEYYRSTWPALEYLEIASCPNLNIRAELEENVQNLTEKLRYLSFLGRNRLRDEIQTFKHYGFRNLETLTIDSLEFLQSLDADRLPSVNYLKFTNLQEEEGLCRVPASSLISLKSVTHLTLIACHRMRQIFSPTVAHNLLQLKNLTIIDCQQLEQIFIEDDDDESHQVSLKDNLRPPYFPNLNELLVTGCIKLKSLFYVNIARGLQKLRSVYIEGSLQLEEVFTSKGGADTIGDNEIVMAELQWLSFTRLPCLISIGPVGYHFIFPSLDPEVYVYECPKLSKQFLTREHDGMHAKREAPQTGMEDVSEQSMEDVNKQSVEEVSEQSMEDVREQSVEDASKQSL